MQSREQPPPNPSFWSRVWRPPEPEISAAGFGGEILVAWTRLALISILIYIQITEYVRSSFAENPRVLLATACGALLGALMIFSATRRHWGRSWIGFASSLLDVSLVSGALVTFLVLGRPHEATNNLVIFPVYFLAVAATSLRYDARICVMTGALAVLQYAGIAFYASSHWHLNAAAFAPFTYGVFRWSDQLWRLAQLAGATLVSATLVVRTRELRLLSTRDRFTGLLNRAVFNEQLDREVAFANREGTRFAVAMLDIDHFKKFNDTYGHAGGDEALRMVAQTLRRSCRETDVVARYGGEEFALILPGVRSTRAHDLLERFRREVAATAIKLSSRARPVSVTISIGVASWPEDGSSAAEILACADRCLYEAKGRGRDQVVVNSTRAPRPAGERENDPADPSDPSDSRGASRGPRNPNGDVLTSSAPLVPPDR
jgi:diguanylate cyclase (GGDEF)-like protein